jgi:hypothetical protein
MIAAGPPLPLLRVVVAVYSLSLLTAHCLLIIAAAHQLVVTSHSLSFAIDVDVPCPLSAIADAPSYCRPLPITRRSLPAIDVAAHIAANHRSSFTCHPMANCHLV